MALPDVPYVIPGSSSQIEASHIISTVATKLFTISCYASSVSGFLMTFNGTTVPNDGAVDPVECIPIVEGTTAQIDHGLLPEFYPLGLVVVFSTTGPFTKTASATAFFKWRAQ